MTLTVLLDCDGVLSNFRRSIVEVVNRTLGRTHVESDVNQWSFASALGLTPEEAWRVKRAVADTPGYAASMTPLPGALEGVNSIRQVADVHIVTSGWSSHPTWVHEREAWLKRHFDIPHSAVTHTSQKWRVAGDVFVDDLSEHVDGWVRAHPTGVGVYWAPALSHALHGVHRTQTDSWHTLTALVMNLWRGSR